MADGIIGSAEFELRASRRQLPADLAKAEREVSASLKKIEGSGNRAGDALEQGFGGGASSAISKATMLGAVIGTLVTALIAAAGAALRLGLDGMQAALGIDEMSRRLGYSTDVVQEMRYAVRQLGQDASVADRVLENFAQKFASAATGASKEALRAFGAIGFSQEDLRRIGDVNEALDLTIQRLSSIRSPVDKAAVADALGLGDLVAGLQDGADGLQEMQIEAHRLGYVMDEGMVRRAAEAKREYDGLQDLIGVQLRQAFIDLAPAINGALTIALSLANTLREAADAFRSIENRSTQGIRDRITELDDSTREHLARARQPTRQGVATGGAGGGVDEETGLPNNPLLRREVERNRAEQNRLLGVLRGRNQVGQSDRPTPPSTISLSTPPRGRTPRDTSAADARRALQAERRYEDMLRRSQDEVEETLGRSLALARDNERIEALIASGQTALAEALSRRGMTAQDRADLEEAALARDSEEALIRIERMHTDGELTDARKAELVAAEQSRRAAEQAAIDLRLQAETIAERLEVERAITDLSAELISVQASTATTLDERRRLEQELLSISQEQRRAQLEALLASQGITNARRQELRGILSRLEEGERSALDRRNAGPLEQWRRAGDDLNTQLQTVAADGLDRLNDGILDAILNTENLGETFRRVAQSIIADLARIAIRRAVVEPLANLLFPGSAGIAAGLTGGLGKVASSVGGNWTKLGVPSVSAPALGAMSAVQQSEVLVKFVAGPAFGGEVLKVTGPVIAKVGEMAADAGAQQALSRLGSMQRNGLGHS